MLLLTHGLELRDEFLLGPLLLLTPERDGAGNDQLVVVGIGNVEVMNQDDVRILQQPVAASMKGGKDGRVNIAAVDALQKQKPM